MKKPDKRKNTETGIIAVSMFVLAVFVVLMAVRPKETLETISFVFNTIIRLFGPIFELVFFITFIFAVYLGVGKYGKIRMGNEKPQYSMFSYISMMLLASLASAALYWSFTEWAYYYQSPGLGMEPFGLEALESSIGYQFFHWGITNQAVYTVMGVAIAYGVYVKKTGSFQTSVVCCSMLGEKAKGKKWIGKVIDFCVVFGILGGLSSSLGLAVPLSTAGIQKLTGIEITPALKIGVIVFIAVVYTIMSYVGIDKGMKMVSNVTAVLCILFLGYIFLAGPTSFILKNIVNSMGHMIQNLPRMSLFTDPIENTGFAESWTIYFEAFYLNYVAMMGIFIAKISKGRSIREITFATLLGISAGGWVLFGVNGSFSINMHLENAVDVVSLVNSGVGDSAVYEILKTLPLGQTLLPAVILLLIVGFVAPSLDSASLALAETVTKRGEPKKRIRLFWCVMLAVIPMCIVLTNSDFTSIKQLSIIISVPFLVIVCGIEIGLLKWLRSDWDCKSRIEKHQNTEEE